MGVGCAVGALVGGGAVGGGAGEVAAKNYSSVTESLRASTSSRSLSSPPCVGGNSGPLATLLSTSTTLYFNRECWREVAREDFWALPSSAFSFSSKLTVLSSTACTLADSVASAL